MQQPDKEKLKHLSKFSQLILLNDEARLISSCDSIFSTKDLKNLAVTAWFPFLESIFDYLLQLNPVSPEVKFSKIETPINLLPGIYDFTFSKILIDQKELLLWTIYDYTNLYEDFKHYQQRKNEYEILREILELRHKNLRSIEDINTEQNVTLEDFNHIQLHYFNNLKSALKSPVNVLDGFTFLLSSELTKDKSTYLSALKNSISAVQKAINTLESLPQTETQTKLKDHQQEYLNPEEVLNTIAGWIQGQFPATHDISIETDEIVPTAIYCNKLILQQIFFGLLSNILKIHPDSHLHIGIKTVFVKSSSVRLSFQITEYLGRKPSLTRKENLKPFVLSLSVIKQLIDLQKGNIAVDNDPKSLGINITCEMEFGR